MESWKAVTDWWLVTVNKLFMLNFTIHNAFVPFLDNCNPHRVAIHEGHIANSEIKHFCGHVFMESVFSKFNKGLVYLNVETSILRLPVTLSMSYQVLLQGSVYTFFKSCFPKHWIANYQYAPFVSHHITHTQYETEYIWYKKVVSLREAKNDIVASYININQMVSNASYCTLYRYVGLVNSYWRTLRTVHPKLTIKCNYSDVHADSCRNTACYHIFETIVLKAPIY